MMQEYKKISTTKVLPMEALAEFEASRDSGYHGYVAEEKFDGSRFGVVKDSNGDFTFLSTQGKDRTANAVDLVFELAQLNIPNDTILDCEVVHLDAPREKRWELSRSVMGTKDYNADVERPHLVIFDVQRVNGIDLTDGTYTFADRREVIYKLFEGKTLQQNEHNPTYWYHGMIAYPELFTANVFSALMLEVLNAGGEGIMVKDLESTKYGKSWIKVKRRFTIDCIVTGATQGTGKYKGLIGALELGVVGDLGQTISIGKCSGMTDEQRREFTEKLPSVIEVSAFEVTKNLQLRHPAFNRVREDKKESECSIEQVRSILNVTRK